MKININTFLNINLDLSLMEKDQKYEFINDFLIKLLMDQYQFSENVKNFIQDIMFLYNDNKFHNYEHAFCVTQMAYYILYTSQYNHYISINDKIGLIIACLLHDIKHPGKTNDYLIKTKDQLYIYYGHESTLEEHHYYTAIPIVSAHLRNILPRDVDINRIMFLIRDLILSTDPTKHNNILNNLKEIDPEDFIPQRHEHLIKLLRAIIRVSDISNEIRNKNYADYWFQCYLQELNDQYKDCLTNNISIDSSILNTIHEPLKCQIYFLKNILLPLIQEIDLYTKNLDFAIAIINQRISLYKNMSMSKNVLVLQPN